MKTKLPRIEDYAFLSDTQTGFSCREQVRQSTDRVPLHLSEVMQMATCENGKREKTAYPERNYVTAAPKRPSLLQALSVLALGAILGRDCGIGAATGIVAWNFRCPAINVIEKIKYYWTPNTLLT